jgi:hypothetical protein
MQSIDNLLIKNNSSIIKATNVKKKFIIEKQERINL